MYQYIKNVYFKPFFRLNNNGDFDNYESTISGEPYMWRNQDEHWDATLDFNLCGTAPWTDIHH